MKDWYQSTEMEALDRLQVTKNGLSSRQIEERQKEYGKNMLMETKKKSILQVFLD